MRGEEWGKIVVDGTTTSRLFTCGTILFLPSSTPSIYSHFPSPYANSRSRASWPLGALDPGEGVGGGAGTHGAHRPGTCYLVTLSFLPLQTISRLPSARLVIYIYRSIISYFQIFTPPPLTTLLPSLPTAPPRRQGDHPLLCCQRPPPGHSHLLLHGTGATQAAASRGAFVWEDAGGRDGG